MSTVAYFAMDDPPNGDGRGAAGNGDWKMRKGRVMAVFIAMSTCVSCGKLLLLLVTFCARALSYVIYVLSHDFPLDAPENHASLICAVHSASTMAPSQLAWRWPLPSSALTLATSRVGSYTVSTHFQPFL